MSYASQAGTVTAGGSPLPGGTRAPKRCILKEFVAATGYSRKYAIRPLNHPGSLHLEIARPRPRRYGRDVQKALQLACIRHFRHPSAITCKKPDVYATIKAL